MARFAIEFEGETAKDIVSFAGNPGDDSQVKWVKPPCENQHIHYHP